MWEHSLIESKGFRRSTKRWLAIPAAAVLHVVVILAAMFVSYWHVEAIEAPAMPLRYLDAIPVQIGPPPKLGGGQGLKANDKQKPPVKQTQPKVIQDLPVQEQEGPEPEHPGDSGDGLPPGEGNPLGIDEGEGNVPYGYTMTGVSAAEQPRVVTTEMRPPLLIHRVEPEYPLLATRSRLQGIVIFEAVITKAGDVEQIKTLRADYPSLEKAAKDAVLQWKYQPATIQGRPVKVYFTVTVTF